MATPVVNDQISPRIHSELRTLFLKTYEQYRLSQDFRLCAWNQDTCHALKESDSISEDSTVSSAR